MLFSSPPNVPAGCLGSVGVGPFAKNSGLAPFQRPLVHVHAGCPFCRRTPAWA